MRLHIDLLSVSRAGYLYQNTSSRNSVYFEKEPLLVFLKLNSYSLKDKYEYIIRCYIFR